MDGQSGTPAPDAGTSGPEPNAQTGGGFDFERGYNELRPEYTRTTQRLSEYEQLFEALHDSDPEVQKAAMDALGLELDTGSQGSARKTDDEFVDPLEEEVKALRSVVDELHSARELEAAKARESELAELRDEFIGEAISFIEQNTNVKFNEREEEALGNLAIAMEKDGTPDVQGAYNLLYGEAGVLETNRQRWIASKTGAPMPPIGTSIPADQRPTTKAERISYVDERMRALDEQR